MDPERREQLEREVHALCRTGNHAVAVTQLIRGYGPEVLGFLHAVHPAGSDAEDAFAEVCEVLWRKLPEFGFQSTLRTWVYGVARNVSRTLRRDAGRRNRREAPVGESALEDVAQAVRTETLAYLRSEKRTRLQELRDTLPEEERVLLVLRVERKLEWNELATVFGAAGADSAPEGETDLRREAARLRKRFQLLKEKLRDAARKEGLLA